jgi:Tol biopolymer transport system component
MKAERISAAVLVVLCLASGATLSAREDDRLRQLTSDPAQEGFPSWSPDGTTIVFSRGDDTPGKTGLWTIPATGGEPVQLTDFIAEHPDWSSDGRYIVFDADRGNSIKLISSAGGGPIRVVPDTIPVSRGGNPNWSPDDSRIAFREGSNLWVLDVSTGRHTNVFHEAGMIPIPGCWSRDGKSIYVSLRAEDAPDSAIWLISSTGEGNRRLSVETDRVYRYMDLSPDGSLLAVVACEGRNCDLWVMPSGGGRMVRITTHPAYDDTPRWSPDGRTIAFTSTRSGNFDVWTVEVNVEDIRADLDAGAEPD